MSVGKLIALLGGGLFLVRALVVGAGGSGDVAASQGGKGGQVKDLTIGLRRGSYAVTVGTGAPAQANGTPSSIAAIISANGGLAGAVTGNGADGPTSNITGSSVIYGSDGGQGGPGSTSGSGAGAPGQNPGNGGGNGLANRGGGGGGPYGDGGSGGAGGSGIVVVRYPTGSITASGGTPSTVGGDTVRTFTSSGTLVVS